MVEFYDHPYYCNRMEEFTDVHTVRFESLQASDWVLCP